MIRRGCAMCGKKQVAGRTMTYRGQLKRVGGVGRKRVRKNVRKFHPNLQRIRVLFEGSVRHLNVCVACVRNGRIVKAPPRQPYTAVPSTAESQ